MISLKDREWKPFILGDIFTITRGNASNIINRATNDGKGVIISALDNSNGFYSNTTFNNKDKVYRDTLTVNNNGNGVCLAYYHPYKFVSSSDVSILENKTEIKFNKYIFEFFICLIEKQKTKYNYGYKMSNGRMTKQSIMLPVNKNGNPDYEFMEAYMRERESNLRKIQISKIQKRIANLGKKRVIPSLNEKEWIAFKLKDIFTEIERGKRLKNGDHVPGIKPYVSSSAIDNGVADWVSNDTNVREFSNCLSLANSGSVGSCFYEPFTFVASDHITHLKNNSFNEYIYLFCANMLSRLSEKYNFNREINDNRISKEIIMLPVDNDSNPDYMYMEQYVKNIEIEKYNRYLEFI